MTPRPEPRPSPDGDGLRTRGQAAASAAVRTMLRGRPPQAILLVGPAGVGKTTLALDLAAGILCDATDPALRPCRACRACRMVEHGNHPDLHRLGPEGPGGSIGIGGPGRPPGVRDLVGELSLLPVEGGARVAIVEPADRLTEDAQSAFLKTLEEPPAGTTLILVAEEEDRLLTTVRSRCIRLRLGTMGPRDVEAVLDAVAGIEAPVAARAARLAAGRPGIALAYARAPEAVRLRGEIARGLLDLLPLRRTDRLTRIRELAARAGELASALGAASRPAGTSTGVAGRPGPGRGRTKGRAVVDTTAPVPVPDPATAAADDSAGPTSTTPAGAEPDAALDATVRIPASERRAAALSLVAIWRDLVRDLLVMGHGSPTAVRDPDLLDDLRAAVPSVPSDAAGAFLRRLDEAGERLEGNAAPDLVVDILALDWRSTPPQR